MRAAVWRGLLRAGELPYGVVVRHRNRRYDHGRAAVHRVGVPVVSVGNVTTGGTGKTPMVEWLARWLRQRGLRVVLVSRGYGAERGSASDEALQLQQNLPDVPHLQNPDRVAAAQKAVKQLDCQVILLDDAFQHRRIHRDLDIVLIDAIQPFGYGHLLPRGLLREPLAGLGRADLIVLTHRRMVDAPRRAAIWEQVRRYAPDADRVEAAHYPRRLLSSTGRTAALDSLRGRPVAAFCGIGNPAGFRQTLAACGLRTAGFRVFPDHYHFGRGAIESLSAWASGLGDVSALLCTHKDLVKIGLDQIGPHPLWALTIELELVFGRDALEARLRALTASC